MAIVITTDNVIDIESLKFVIVTWEKYNGDVRESPTMCNVLKNIAASSPKSIPYQPRVKEIVGDFKEAAFLYVKEGEREDAAKCYEKAESFEEACKIYEAIDDKESISRTAECLGDLEKALKFVIKPERKVRLLIKCGNFHEARIFAAGLESPEEYFNLIKTEARKQIEAKIKSRDFIGAMELADVAECEAIETEKILFLGHQHFNKRIASASSDEDIESVYREWIELEKKAGNYEEAGRMAEEILNDLDLACKLYELAHLINRAIETASGYYAGHEDSKEAKIKLAELHEKGGNLLKAAKYYEEAEIYDKAYTFYESSQHFIKAIDCYLKTPDPNTDALIRLYRGAGEFEKVIEIYMRSGTFHDLDNALAIAKNHNLKTHIRILEDKMAELFSGTENDLERCFKKARDDVLGTYSLVFGIDFGTTNSVAAIFNKKRRKAEIIPTSRGSEFEPSFFGVDKNNRPVYGETARMRSLIAPDCVVSHVKRSLGENRKYSLGGKEYRSEEIVAKILNWLRLNTEAYLRSKVESTFYDILENENLKFPDETLKAFLNQKDHIHLEEVVLSVPSYFNNNQKRATRDSAEIAGLTVRRLLHEPTAAALAYGYRRPYSGKLAVIDLGGGTLDISILDVGDGVYDVLTVGGDTKLGGSDIDTELVQYVVKDIKNTLGLDINQTTHPIEIARLRDACENLKINLSSLNEYTMELVHFLNKPKYTFTMKRTELEDLSRPILERIKATIENTVKEEGSDIDHFLLVGNATKMPIVCNLVEKNIRAKHLKGIDPGTVVTTGAALEGAVLSEDIKQTLLLDIVPHSLGIAAFDPATTEKKTSILIERNKTIPTEKSEIYTTAKDSQPNVHIEIYQGESTDPCRNYFLGDFVLDGIAPVAAGIPKIEVTFGIDVDCILTVTAVDKGTRNKQSIRIDGAVTLSPHEKQNLSRYFSDSEKIDLLDKELDSSRLEIKNLISACEKIIEDTDISIQIFFEQFHEKVEVNSRLYKVNADQTNAIQEMFILKDQFIHGTLKYKDKLATIANNIKHVEMKHLDISDKAIVTELKERIGLLSNHKEALIDLTESIEQNVTNIVGDWMQVLDSMEPDIENMDYLKKANYHLIAGRANEARDILESIALNEEGLTKEAFHLLLKCYVQTGLREEYRELHKRFGNLFGMTHPDFNQLNSFLKNADESVFIIQGASQQHGIYSGSGFCVAPNLIVTNRHVIEGIPIQEIKIIGKDQTYEVQELETDPINDLAIIKVNALLKPFRLGYFNFVEPGEQVIAIGFPSPGSYVHNENIYISKGIVNSIRKTDFSPERNIFIDAKIGSGMSGGPLINDLGEVVGIITFVKYGIRRGEKGMIALEEQPVALPIHLAKKYLRKYLSEQ